MVAYDASRDRKVIIENQLERTDHDHLGKIITYASGLAADIVIWISPEFREEHRSALDWLNINTIEGREFFGIQIEAWKIDDSRPAPVFRVVASPNDWQKRITSGRTRTAATSRNGDFFVNFYSRFANELKAAGFQRTAKPTEAAWLIVERWAQSVRIAISFSRKQFQAGLFLASSSPQLNQAIFNRLKSQAGAIEAELGFSLTWDFNPERLRQSIWTSIDEIDRDDPDSLQKAREWGLDRVTRMHKVFKPHVINATRDASAEEYET